MRIQPEETMALVIDMQEKLMAAMQNTAVCAERAEMLLSGLRLLSVPIMLTQQYTKGLGNSLPAIREAAGTKDYYEKSAFSCGQDEDIMTALRKMNRRHILILGTEAHVCVLQTCIDLKSAGYEPVLVLDCITSRRKNDMNAGIQRAIQEGITVTSSEAILFELMITSRHPAFKSISALVK